MKDLLAPLEWYTVQKKVSELVPYEYNPRKIAPEDKERLRRSLEKFNLVEDLIKNKHIEVTDR